MTVEAFATLGVPTAALLAGRVAATRRPGRLPLGVAVTLGALAPPALVAWRRRSLVEQLAAWGVGVIGLGGLLLAHDPHLLAASMLVGGAWGALLMPLHADAGRAHTPPQQPPAKAIATTPLTESKEEEEVCISLPCPSCSAAVTFPVYHGMAQCGYCGSRHLVQRAEATLVTVIPNLITDEGVLTQAVTAHLRHLKYLELYDRIVRPLVQRCAAHPAQAPGTPLAPPLDPVSLAAINAAEEQVNRAADAYAARLAPRIKVLHWQPFLAPYWHRTGTLYQVAFGRDEDGTKHMEIAMTHLEGSQPGCATPLPEMGKLSYLRTLRPLLGAAEGKLPALPVEGGRDELTVRMKNMQQRRAAFSFRTITVRGTFVPEVDALVWRPWHVARAAVAGRQHDFLVDGASGRVVPQAPPTLERLGPPPTPPDDEQLRLAPCRCPECGAELEYLPDAVAHLCHNCYRLLEVARQRLRPRRYLREEPLSGHACVPFWRFPLAVRTAEGTLIRDLAHLGDQLDGVLDQLGERPQEQSYLFVPAFRLRLSRAAVRLYRRLWPFLHGAPRPVQATLFDLTSPPRETWPITLSAEEARTFGAFYLALAFTSRDLAKAEVRGVRARFMDATLEGVPELTYLSLPMELVSPSRALLRSHPAPAVAQLAGEAPTAPRTRLLRATFISSKLVTLL